VEKPPVSDGVKSSRPGWGAGQDLIFSTKDLVALIHKDCHEPSHAYMGGIINDLGGVPETIGGVEYDEKFLW